MSEDVKLKLFNEVFKLEQLAQNDDELNDRYWAQSEGAFAILQILGLGAEYIRWSFSK